MVVGAPNRWIESTMAGVGEPAGPVIAESCPGGKPGAFAVRNSGTICRRDAASHNGDPVDGFPGHV